MSQRFNSRTQRQRGQGMTEYIIIVVMIAICAIAAFSAFGGTLRGQIAGASKELSGQDSTQSVARAKNEANRAQTQADKTRKMDDYGQTQ